MYSHLSRGCWHPCGTGPCGFPSLSLLLFSGLSQCVSPLFPVLCTHPAHTSLYPPPPWHLITALSQLLIPHKYFTQQVLLWEPPAQKWGGYEYKELFLHISSNHHFPFSSPWFCCAVISCDLFEPVSILSTRWPQIQRPWPHCVSIIYTMVV